MRLLWHWLWRLVPGNPMMLRVIEGGSRRSRHLWARLGYLGGLVILVLISLLAGRGMGGEVTLTELSKSGADLFKLISYAQVILVCLLAPLFLATAIAQERAGQTMDILLTTPLSNLQIVLGSLLGRLFFVLALLLSGLPLFAVVLIFGGVQMSSVFVSFAVAGLTAITVGAAAITLSVFRAGGRKAVFTFVISVMAYLVAAYMLDHQILQRFNPGQTTWLTPIHPLLVLESTLNTANYHPPTPESLGHLPGPLRFYLSRPFETFAILSVLASVAMTAACALVLRHLGQGGGLLIAWIKAQVHISSSRHNQGWAARTVWQNPIAWREAHTRGGGLAGFIGRWAFTIVGLIAAVVLLALHHFGALGGMNQIGQKPTEIFRLFLSIILSVEIAVIALVAIYMSAGCVSREREDGTLDLMLTTPVTQKQYVWGKLRGLVSFLLVMIATPVLTLALVSAYVVIGNNAGWPVGEVTGQYSSYTPLALYESPLLLTLMLVPFVALCVMVGMSWSLKAKGVLGAVIPSIAILGVLALVLGFCGMSAAKEVPFVGPMLNAFSPATNTLMIVDPWQRIDQFVEHEGQSRIVLMLAALLAAVGYCVIVYAMLLGMVRGFDQTVRKLSGTG